VGSLTIQSLILGNSTNNKYGNTFDLALEQTRSACLCSRSHLEARIWHALPQAHQIALLECCLLVSLVHEVSLSWRCFNGFRTICGCHCKTHKNSCASWDGKECQPPRSLGHLGLWDRCDLRFKMPCSVWLAMIPGLVGLGLTRWTPLLSLLLE
jgi:hypothetical protein